MSINMALILRRPVWPLWILGEKFTQILFIVKKKSDVSALGKLGIES
jgi:hypothetical protein